MGSDLHATFALCAGCRGICTDVHQALKENGPTIKLAQVSMDACYERSEKN